MHHPIRIRALRLGLAACLLAGALAGCTRPQAQTTPTPAPTQTPEATATPAPTGAPLLLQYMTNGMLGGMITPRPPATATRAAQNVRSYPKLVKSGIVMEPTAAVVAGPEPEIAP